MKKANIYNVTIREDSGKTKTISCVATSINDVIDTVALKRWNNDTKEYYYENYTENNIESISLKEADVLVQDYINDIVS